MKLTVLFCRLATCAFLIGLSSCASAPRPSSPPPADEPQVGTPAATASRATTSRATTPAVAKPEVMTLEFKIEIAAPVEKVWDTMLSPEGYQQWTRSFASGSYFEGSWSEGERMHFLGPAGSGMVAVIAANRPHELVSIKHIGFVMNGVEDTTSESVRSWAPAHETYRLAAIPGGTEVTIEQEAFASYEAYMREIWPKALAGLKSLCEPK